MILLKVGSSQPNTLFTGKYLEGMGIDGPGTLQSSMGHTLKTTHTHTVLLARFSQQRDMGFLWQAVRKLHFYLFHMIHKN